MDKITKKETIYAGVGQELETSMSYMNWTNTPIEEIIEDFSKIKKYWENKGYFNIKVELIEAHNCSCSDYSESTSLEFSAERLETDEEFEKRKIKNEKQRLRAEKEKKEKEEATRLKAEKAAKHERELYNKLKAKYES